MGIRAAGVDGSPRAKGAYFVLTTDKEPYCGEIFDYIIIIKPNIP